MLYVKSLLWSPQGVESLEKNADTVVRSDSNFSVIAGPGAGKTELLAQRACYLLQTGTCPSPYRILAISFKRDAAKNLYTRVRERCKNHVSRFDSLTYDAFSKGLLDRFSNALPETWRHKQEYEIFFPESNGYEGYRDYLNYSAYSENNRRIESRTINVDASTFAKKYVLGTLLPLSDVTQVPEASDISIEEIIARRWWELCLHAGDKTKLSFPMIGRLSELILRANPLIRNALRETYSHVFLDEFQDTTNIQYDLLKTAFKESRSIITAVGDNKQHIMRWAMALDDAFGLFKNDFHAKRIYLFNNYRSSEALVKIQHAVALTIDPHSKSSVSKITSSLTDHFCTVWHFENCELEKRKLADFVSETIKNKERSPRDFVILVKQKPDQYTLELSPVFTNFGIKLRSEAEWQDLLVENLTILLINFLRLGSCKRAGKYWNTAFDLLARLWKVDCNDERTVQHLQDKLANFQVELYAEMQDIEQLPHLIVQCIRKIITFLGIEKIKSLYPEYQQDAFWEKMLRQILSQLENSYENCKPSCQWNNILDDFEGADSVPLMTIHKSKGLEYKTVIFLGLDDKAWWSFENQPEETRCAFFVALSRAKEQVIFSYCKERGDRQKINSFYDLLKSCGVDIQVYN